MTRFPVRFCWTCAAGIPGGPYPRQHQRASAIPGWGGKRPRREGYAPVRLLPQRREKPPGGGAAGSDGLCECEKHWRHRRLRGRGRTLKGAPLPAWRRGRLPGRTRCGLRQGEKVPKRSPAFSGMRGSVLICGVLRIVEQCSHESAVLRRLPGRVSRGLKLLCRLSIPSLDGSPPDTGERGSPPAIQKSRISGPGRMENHVPGKTESDGGIILDNFP